jgi:hypothetical protein
MSNEVLRSITELRTPLAFGGLVAALFFFLARQIVGVFSRAELKPGSVAGIVRQILRYFFILSLLCAVLGFLGWLFQLWIQKSGDGSVIGVGHVQVVFFPKYGISEEKFRKLAEEHAVTDQALSRFFNDLGEKNVPREQWPERLTAFAQRYKELNAQIRASPAQTPSDIELKNQGIAAVEKGDLAKAARIAEALPEPPANLQIIQE